MNIFVTIRLNRGLYTIFLEKNKFLLKNIISNKANDCNKLIQKLT